MTDTTGRMGKEERAAFGIRCTIFAMETILLGGKYDKISFRENVTMRARSSHDIRLIVYSARAEI